jgi:hypothetical protein
MRVSSERSTVGRSIRTAVLLALVSVIPVAGSFLIPPSENALRNVGFQTGPIDWQPMSPVGAVLLALAAVLPSAVVGGAIGGFAWRRNRYVAAALALASAWATGIVVMPPAAAVLGIHLRAGIVCVMGCESLLRDDRPFLGILGYAEFMFGTALFAYSIVLPVLVLGIALIALSAWVRGRPALPPRPPLIPFVIAFAVLHGLGLVAMATTGLGGLVPYAAVSIGVVVWTVSMQRAAIERQAGAAPEPTDILGRP